MLEEINKVLDELILGQLKIQDELSLIKKRFDVMTTKLDEVEYLCRK